MSWKMSEQEAMSRGFIKPEPPPQTQTAPVTAPYDDSWYKEAKDKLPPMHQPDHSYHQSPVRQSGVYIERVPLLLLIGIVFALGRYCDALP